jgi:hypothetical protein
MMLRAWIRRITQQKRPVGRSAPSWHLTVEELETRVMPVIGKNASAPLVPSGGPYDGIVRIEGNLTKGTGTLLTTQRHILTAAHVVGGSQATPFPALQITFDMTRPNPQVQGVSTPIPISITIPANVADGNTFQVVPGTHVMPPLGEAHIVWDRTDPEVNDIAIVRLVDQVDPQPNRSLVAPKGATGFGLFAGDAVGKEFRLFGYGLDGTGGEGNNTNEVQKITLTGILPNGPEHTF